MKKRKQKALKYLGLSIVCFGLHACSIFLEPFAVNSENKVAAGGYILGVLFWVTLLAGAVLFGVCREIISKTAGYQEWKQKKIIGVFGFFRTPPARIMDPILLVSFALTIVGNLTGSIPEGVLLVVMAIMLFTFYLHMIVNGRIYRYMIMSERKEKKSGKEGN